MNQIVQMTLITGTEIVDVEAYEGPVQSGAPKYTNTGCDNLREYYKGNLTK